VSEMAKRTAKVGSAGKFGPRYGVRVRKRVRDIDSIKSGPHECPNCHHRSVKRVSVGIWKCRHCETKFAASAYSPRTMRLVGTERKTRGGA
jgi:large subunit ribosomal protein L37Ae